MTAFRIFTWKFSTAAIMGLFLSLTAGCNDPLNPAFTRVDRYMSTTTGTVDGTLMMVDPDTAHGFEFPTIYEGANVQFLFFDRNIPYTTATDGDGNPLRIPSAIAVRSLASFHNDDLELGLPETLEYSLTKFDGLPLGDYSVTVILDLNGNGTYDPADDCVQILPEGTVPVEGETLPTTVTVADDTHPTMSATFIPGATMCGPGMTASTGSLSGTVDNDATAIKIQATTVMYVFLFYEPADGTDPSDGGSIPPDYIWALPMALALPVGDITAGNLNLPISINAGTAIPAGTLPPGDYGITVYLSQNGGFPTGVPNTYDCWGGAATTFNLGASGDNPALAAQFAGCLPP